jgi:ubiquitin-protein ligase
MSTTVKNNESITLTKETVMRLVKDVKELIKAPLTSHGIHYQHNETDMLKGTAMIVGPKDTPYEYGFYLFNFAFPVNYPHSPPVVKFCTGDGMTRFNPNLYKNGKVCLSVLNTWNGEQWTGCQSISSVLLALCMVLNNEPLLNEPGVKKSHRDYNNYNKVIEYKNIDVAIHGMMTHPSTVEHFSMFLDIMKNSFIENYDSIMCKINTKIELYDETDDETETVNTVLYNMSTTIDYRLLKSKIKILKDDL